jgi:phosphoenolpyruvate synthase/pyruvate phosphate dikinase
MRFLLVEEIQEAIAAALEAADESQTVPVRSTATAEVSTHH